MIITPKIIGTIPIDTQKYHRQLLKKAFFSKVDIEGITPNDSILVALRQTAVASGLIINTSWKDRYYGLHDYVFSAGSIFAHEDPGMGLTVGVLVAVADLSRSFHDGMNGECALFAEGQHICIRVGDVFLFDADKEHAWMANCRWVIATQSVLPPVPPQETPHVEK
jgi:hypothetical protein